MTQENKELLLQDLCARLPYGVKGKTLGSKTCTLSFIGNDGSITADTYHCWLSSKQFVPYLRPMSSMTEEEYDELCECAKSKFIGDSKEIDWLNANHFDYRGLIENGLAIAVTKENNPYSTDKKITINLK